MSPEQGSGHSLTEATDWYSLGVMLFEALTGQWPFTGSFVEMMWDKRHREAAAPRDLVPDLPEGLNALCVDLLRREPERRPNGDEILARLGAVQAATFRPSAVPSAEQPGAPFVGRDRELAALRSAFEAARAGRAEIVRLSGLSGSGKTALARRFLSEARRSGAVVLAGRCYERESVPYKALDSLVDALSQFLKKLPGPETKEILPRDVLALARLFPVLRRVEAVSGARRRVLEIPDSQELRRRAFGALRELLTRLAEQQDLVLFVDDLQWGDTDSAVLLADLLRPPRPPALLFLASYRSEATASSPFLRKFLELGTDPEGVELRDVPVDPLSEDEANYLTVALLGKDAETEPVRALEIARESGGNPLFLGELVRFAQAGIEPSEARRIARLSSGGVPVEATLDDMIRSRILRLPETSRRLLETLAVAGQPLRPAVARHSAGIDAGEALDLLLDAHLVRRRQSRDREEIEPYHDRIREAAVTRLSPEELRGYHHRLAAALEGSGTTDPEALALHFQEAGEPDRAAEYATAAADRAAEALAFDRAARLFRLARELRPPSDGSQRRRLSVRLGDALVNAGRGAEAAAAYLEAVEGADAADSLELQRRAAEQYLVSGHIAEGVSTLRTVLYKVGLRMAFTPRSALFSMLFRRALLRLRGLGFREKDPSRITAQTLTRIDVCWAAARGLTLSDLLRGADFQARHVLLALRAGEPFRAARALAFEVGVSAMGGGRSRLRTARLLEAATSVAHRLGDPYAIGFTLSVAGVAAVLEGRWKDSKTYTERAGAMLRERCRGVAWELDNTHYYSLLALFYLGELKRLDETLPALLKEAGERGDLYAATSIRTRVAYILQLVRDEPQRAREELREAISVWPDDVFLLQHWYADMGQVECLLYAGESEAAWDLVQKLWPRLEKSLYLRAQIVLVHSLSFRARTAIAAAVSRETDSLLGDAERDARRIEGEGTPWAAGLAVLLRAGAASARGQKPRALGLLATAEEKFTAADMALHATLARRRRGQLLPGVEGRALVEEADRWMSEQGVRNPDRMAAMLAPGAWAPR
jgi:tetratricopeptide (TPR) repeat protein